MIYLTDTYRPHPSKRETRKANRRGFSFAPRLPALFPMLVFLGLVGTMPVSPTSGQVPYPKIPAAQDHYPPGYLPGMAPSSRPAYLPQPTTGMDEYQRNLREGPIRQQQMEEFYRDIERTNGHYFVDYDLPSCSGMEGTGSYEEAFAGLSEMADDIRLFDLRKANFAVENAFYENKGNQQDLDKVIGEIGRFLRSRMAEANYDTASNLAKNLMLFRFFSDTLEVAPGSPKHLPFRYDFEDYMGREDWSKTFVLKALATRSGQCHSLPMLYLILADEIGAEATLSYSPAHTYVKFRDDQGKWHNVELTNGMMTTDAFILQSGFVKAEALQNRIYMQPLSDRQLLSLQFFDLAKGYTAKYCYDGFVGQVIDKALELDPNNVNAQMLKSDYLTLSFMHVADQLEVNESNYVERLNQFPRAAQMFVAMKKQYEAIDGMGYEEMSPEAYGQWLGSLNEAQKQQESNRLLNNMTKTVQLNTK